MTWASAAMIGAARPRLDACGARWRLRSLVAMGHDANRIADALQTSPRLIQSLLRGETAEVEPEFRDLVCQLWNAWWDKRPPERTRTERRQAGAARRRAEQHGWCPPLGLDEDEVDEPGYRPYSRYREAIGTGIAGDFHPIEQHRKTSGGRHERERQAASYFAESKPPGAAGSSSTTRASSGDTGQRDLASRPAGDCLAVTNASGAGPLAISLGGRERADRRTGGQAVMSKHDVVVKWRPDVSGMPSRGPLSCPIDLCRHAFAIHDGSAGLAGGFVSLASSPRPPTADQQRSDQWIA